MNKTVRNRSSLFYCMLVHILLFWPMDFPTATAATTAETAVTAATAVTATATAIAVL